MPPRHYKFKLRNNKIKRRPLIDPITLIEYFEINYEYSDFQIKLFDIVDIITQRLEISEITTQINNLINSLSSAEELRNLLDIVESTSISIIQNFADGTDIGIISCRISYLRTLIDTIPDGAHEEYAKIGLLILDILEMLTEGADISNITNKIIDIQSTLKPTVDIYDAVDEIKTLICGIVQNIADGTDIGIITCRINYLRELIDKIPEAGLKN
jgi:hypothetical protein